MPIAEGSKLPEVSGFVMAGDRPSKVSLAQLTAGKKTVIFGVPGAFTGTCTNQHLPSYVRDAQALRAKGVDSIFCMATNDIFVMEAWNKAHGSGDIQMLADGNGDVTRALDLGLDASGFGLGYRCTRFAMYVVDGVVKALNVEANPGACSVSSAQGILERI